MKVLVENLTVRGRHGVFDEERAEGRVFRFDVVATLDHWPISDELLDTVDYRSLVEIIMGVVEGESLHLIETMAWRIVDQCFSTSPPITHVALTIRKRATGVTGDPEWVGGQFDCDKAAWLARGART